MSWSYVTPGRRNRQACSSVHIPGKLSTLFGPTTTAANTPPDQDIARNPRSAQATSTAQPLTVKPYHLVLRKTGLEAAGAVRSMCDALRIHPLGACPLVRIVTIPLRRVMAQCTENIAASCSMRRPLLPVPRAYHVGPDLGLAGGTLSSPGGRLRRPRGIPGLPGQPRSPADHREAHPADSGPARRGPARVLTRTRPRLIWPIIAALLRFIRLSGQLQVRNRWKRIPVLAASGVRPWACGRGRAAFELFRPRGPGQGLCGSDQTWIPGECHDQS